MDFAGTRAWGHLTKSDAAAQEDAPGMQEVLEDKQTDGHDEAQRREGP